MTNLKCDVAVIGGGTAGLAAERTARRAGANTLLIDEGFAGTTCARVGCMPSKLLIAAAEAAHGVRRAAAFGLEATLGPVDGNEVMARVRRERDAFVAGVQDEYDELPDGVRINAHAAFIAATTLRLDDGRVVEAKAIVIAVGAKPAVPKAFADVADHVLTNETIFGLPQLPASIAVIGAGPLGLELAQALARLDVDVVVLDEGETIAGLKDRDLAKVLRETIEQEVPIHLGVKTAARNAPGGVEVSWTGDSEGTRLFDKLLVAIGRPPRFDGLEVAAAGLKLDDNGVPVFDPTTLQCGSSPIFIVGDADHDRAVLHDAANEGGIAGHNAATFPKIEPSRRTVPMSIMFTDPPLAVVGKIGRPNDLIVVRGCASYTDQGRAKITLRNTGAVHIYADAQDGRIVGAALACPGAEHLAHLLAWAIEFRQTAIQFLEFPIYHPTYEEGLKPALREICAAVKAETPTDRDDGFIPGA